MPSIIKDPYASIGTTVIQTRIPDTVERYLFRGAFAGTRGLKQALLNIFLEALHKECLAQGIEPHWDDKNEHRLSDILSRLNFRAGPVKPGRPNRNAPKRKAQSSSVADDGGTVDGVREQVTAD